MLTRQHKFRYKPFEWLYEGLDPLLLQPVLEKRQGIPLTLAVLYCSVGLRLGIPLLPQRVPPPATGTMEPWLYMTCMIDACMTCPIGVHGSHDRMHA